MCSEQSVMSLVKLAKKQEKDNPEAAAQSFLEAAKILVKLSRKEREKEFMEMANKMYLKAKSLRKENVANYNLKQATIIPKVGNKITFDSIGGLEDLKEEIKFKIIEPLKKPSLFKFYGKKIGGGILMYGPPGCGKSLIAKATANEANTTFIHVKSSDLKSKYVGETEKNIAELFEKARQEQPAIIFFDEFEVLGADRSNGLSHERSAVAQLLTEMDGMDSKDKDQQILLLAATNEPWSIDPALRREGRFGTSIYIPPPDQESRKKIMQLMMQNRPIKEIDFNKLAKLTEGFSGADMKSVCEQATDIPLKESMSTGKRRKIKSSDIRKAIKSTNSIISEWFQKAKDQIQQRKLEDSFKPLFEDDIGKEMAVV